MRIISILIAALAITSVVAQAQQPAEQSANPAQVATTSFAEKGIWRGTWQSNTSAATGELTVQLISVLGVKVAGKLSMTRPSNQLPRWSCIDTPIEFTGEKQGDQITIKVDFKGGCNMNEFKFAIKSGKLQGVYTTQSGAQGTYVLELAELVASAN